MAWTTPRTWVTSEVVTAALMNTHVRDNTQYLKDVLDGVQAQAIYPTRAAADTGGPTIIIRKGRGSIGTPSIITTGDNFAEFYFQGYDGSSYQTGGAIIASSDGTPGAGDMPGKLIFYTTPDGTATALERWRITSTGNLWAGGDGSVSVPVISWLNDTDTGIYRSTADNIDFATGGTQIFKVGTNGAYVATTNGYSFLTDTDTYLTSATDVLHTYVGGSRRFSVIASSTVHSQSGAWAQTNNAALDVSKDAGVPLFVNRNTDDGTLISFLQGDTEEGTISVSGATVSYNGFMGAHYVQLKPEQAQPPRYGVVAADDNLIPSENPDGPARENEPYIRPARAADPAVYGVWGGKIKDDAAGSSFGIDGQPVYQVASLGLYRCLACDEGGPIAVGDLLEAAGTRWHARRQADDIVRSSTLGKALEALTAGKGSVACVLYAG